MVLRCEAPAFEKFKPTVLKHEAPACEKFKPSVLRREVPAFEKLTPAQFWSACRLLFKKGIPPGLKAWSAGFWKFDPPSVFFFIGAYHLGSIFLVGNSKNFLGGFTPEPLLTSSLGSPESLSRRKSCREFPGSCIFLIGNPRKFPGGFGPGLHLYWARFARQNRYRDIKK